MALALKEAQQIMRDLGYSLVVYDSYRPQKAVDSFMEWGLKPQDNFTKESYYPYINKCDIVPKGYLDPRSTHSRGSTVDLTIIRLDKNIHEVREVPYQLKDGRTILLLDDGTEYMGGNFDLFDESSHHDSNLVDEQATKNRNLLRNVMKRVGFE